MAASLRTYLKAGAWQRAHDLAFPSLQAIWGATDLPANLCETLGLLLIACHRLDHADHLSTGTRWLLSASRQGSLSPEALALVQYHESRAAADAGEYSKARELAARVEGSGGDDSAHVSRLTRTLVKMLIARIEARRGSLDASEQAALEAIELAEHSGSDMLLADSLRTLANVLSTRRDLDSAQQILARAAALYWPAGDARNLGSTLLNRGWVLFCQGHLDDSRFAFQEAARIAAELDRSALALRARLGLGWIAARTGDVQEARRLLLRAWREARRAGLPREEGLALEYLSEAYLVASDYKVWLAKVRVTVDLGMRIAQRLTPLGDVTLEMKIRQAMLLLAEERPAQSAALAREAIAHARRIQMPWEEGEAHRILGTAHAHANKLQGARESFSTSWSTFKSIGETFERSVAEAWLRELDREQASAGSDVDGRANSNQGRRASGEPSALRHWLEHPLFGPVGWRRRNENRLASSGATEAASDQGRTSPGGGGSGARRVGPPETAAEKPHRRPPSTGLDLAPLWAQLGLLTHSPGVVHMLTLAQTYAPEEIPVLILGETGSGKDLVARGIHDLSGRSGRFVPVNCAAAQRHLFAAELFGARKGAYTGAIEHRQGLIQEAEKGTLFFDEIADLDAEAQGFLLRFLDSGEVRPLGSTKWTRLEVRILAATCRDLRRRASQGLFREDLYARMAAVVLRVPPLRDRLDDLVPLLWMFWERMGGTQEERETVFTPEMLERLKQYPWPGNVRDLRHLVALAIPLLRAQGAAAARIHVLQWAKRERLLDRPADHPAAVRDTTDTAASGPASPGSAEPRNEVAGIPHIPPEALGRIISGRWTADTLQRALEAAEGNIPAAARALGVSRSQAYRLYRELRESLG